MDSYLVNIEVVGAFELRTVIVRCSEELAYLVQLLTQSSVFQLIGIERIPTVEDYNDFVQMLNNEIKPDNLNFG